MASIPKSSARGYHHGDLKAALKAAALELVKEHGPRGFSLNQASRMAGVSVAAPYRHFPDKEALLAEIICDGNALLESELRASIAKVTGLRQQMLASGEAYIRFARLHPEYFAVMFQSGFDKANYPEIAQTGQRAFSVIRDLCAQADSSPATAQERAISLWALVHGIASLAFEGAFAQASRTQPSPSAIRSLLERALQDI